MKSQIEFVILKKCSEKAYFLPFFIFFNLEIYSVCYTAKSVIYLAIYA